MMALSARIYRGRLICRNNPSGANAVWNQTFSLCDHRLSLVAPPGLPESRGQDLLLLSVRHSRKEANPAWSRCRSALHPEFRNPFLFFSPYRNETV